MNKQPYIKPSIEVIDILPVAVMALSGPTPGLGEGSDNESAGAPRRPAKTCAAFWHGSDWYTE